MPLGLEADSIFFGCLGATGAGADDDTGAGAGDLDTETGCPKLLTTKLLILNGAFVVVAGAFVVVVGALVVVVGALVVVVVGGGVVVVGAGAAVVVVGFSSTTAAGNTTPLVLMSTIFSTVGAAVVTGTTGFSVRISTNLTDSGASSGTGSFLPGLWNFLPVLNRGPKNCSAVRSVLTGLFWIGSCFVIAGAAFCVGSGLELGRNLWDWAPNCI